MLTLSDASEQQKKMRTLYFPHNWSSVHRHLFAVYVYFYMYPTLIISPGWKYPVKHKHSHLYNCTFEKSYVILENIASTKRLYHMHTDRSILERK